MSQQESSGEEYSRRDLEMMIYTLEQLLPISKASGYEYMTETIEGNIDHLRSKVREASRINLSQQARKLCHAIEDAGASEQLTDASLMASDLYQLLAQIEDK